MPASDQGVTHDRYTLIPRTLIFLTCGERVLLLKGAPHKRLWANRYNGVGGHIERGEDVLTSARRELAEETGLQVPDLWLCGVITVDTGQDTGIGIYVLKGECPSGEISSFRRGQLGMGGVRGGLYKNRWSRIFTSFCHVFLKCNLEIRRSLPIILMIKKVKWL